MIGLLVLLVLVGVGLYLIEQIPMDGSIKVIIRVVVILCVVLYLVQAFGLLDVPLPRLGRR